ncbi:MAG TPA: DUF3237 domain-containing protein [Rudaea sp.]|jgi:hypothetical protein|uniref:DUF3237 domain-containing protein n=1 Tax=Rudaea sp. TaxID=2136325 RepID=UPI002F9496DE
MQHLFSYSATLRAPPEVIGPVPEGIRATFYITGGEFSGPRLRGRLLAQGGDWFTVRHDGVGVLDVRGTIETNDGALIYLAYQGLSDLGTDGYAKFLRGELPPTLPLRTAPVLRCAHPDYAWLHRTQMVGVGEVDLQRFVVAYDVYAVQ